MGYFTKEFLEFFRLLEKNNSTEWFRENKPWYETAVKEPFYRLVEEMIQRIHQYDPKVAIAPKDAIFRINRDIRFSKDKSPYKTHASALISREGKKSKEAPGFYFQLSAHEIMIAGGAYMVEKENLHKIRTKIARSPKEFEKLLKHADFKKKFGALQGETNKILPKEFQSAVKTQPLIANKQFYYMAELPVKAITGNLLPDVMMAYYKAGQAVNSFLREAMYGKR
ncbi:DUF2461 domain-containing protein [bacterium]|nr:DUF2461 domain-containing protein [bacterium]